MTAKTMQRIDHIQYESDSETLLSSLPSQNLKFFLEVMDSMSSEIKRKGTFQLFFFLNSSKASICDGSVWGCVVSWVTCIFVKSLLIVDNKQRFWSNILCSHVNNTLFREGLTYQSQTTPNHILHILKQHPQLKTPDDKLASLQSQLVTQKRYLPHYEIQLHAKVCATLLKKYILYI